MADDGGLSRIQRRLNAIPRRIKERLGAVAVEEAEKIAGDMRSFAEASRDTGALIESITITGPGQTTPPYSQPGGMTRVSDTGAMIAVGNEDVRYPHLVEYGTDAVQAQPFFWPAVDMNKKKTNLRLRREARKAVREQWGKK